MLGIPGMPAALGSSTPHLVQLTVPGSFIVPHSGQRTGREISLGLKHMIVSFVLGRHAFGLPITDSSNPLESGRAQHIESLGSNESQPAPPTSPELLRRHLVGNQFLLVASHHIGRSQT